MVAIMFAAAFIGAAGTVGFVAQLPEDPRGSLGGHRRSCWTPGTGRTRFLALWGVVFGGGLCPRLARHGRRLPDGAAVRRLMGLQFMKTSLASLMWVAFAGNAWAQTCRTPVPESEVFTREQIGHALAAPTPQAGHTAASAANAPEDDGQWTMPSKNYASTRYSSLAEITPRTSSNCSRSSASRWRSTRARKRRRSWPTTRCTWSPPIPTTSMRWI